MSGPELVRALSELADRLELLRAELLERSASGELRSELPAAVPAACRLASHAGALARELYAREVEARGGDAGDLGAL